MLFGVGKILSQTPFVCKGQYYLSLTKNGSQSSQLYRIKISSTGETVLLDTISTNLKLVLNAMGYRHTDNFIYGLDPQESTLRRVGSDGVAIDLGLPKGIPQAPVYYAGDVTPDGRYLLIISINQPSQIVKIDLEDPEFSCSFLPLKNKTIRTVDIAFDPFTSVLYGHDFVNQRLITIDPVTGDVDENFIKQPRVNELGALFFDSFGNLYGYGSYDTDIQNKFIKIDKKTGQMNLLASGPISNGQDGCACPYTLELQKIVTPDTANVCTKVVYSFAISNGTGSARSGISLVDSMPFPLQPLEVIKNPFGGIATINGNVLSITNMTVNPGIDTIHVSTAITAEVVGSIKNQAILSGLPIALGTTSLSDDPSTLIDKDSTELVLEPIDLSFIKEEHHLCVGDSVLFDGSQYAFEYKWSDGSTVPKRWLTGPNEYQLEMTTMCEKYDYDISVIEDFATVDIIPEVIDLNLGDSIYLASEFTSWTNMISFDWASNTNYNFSCDTCQNTMLIPFNTGVATLQLTNPEGCNDIDTVMIRVKKDNPIHAPNIFSPNKDGNNDYFYLFGNNMLVSSLRLRIYDRWGNKVFDQSNGTNETFRLNTTLKILNNPDMGWNGFFNDREASEGVYAWVANLLCVDGQQILLKGDVTVVR
jgi:gliding motility-associated-like protein